MNNRDFTTEHIAWEYHYGKGGDAYREEGLAYIEGVMERFNVDIKWFVEERTVILNGESVESETVTVSGKRGNLHLALEYMDITSAKLGNSLEIEEPEDTNHTIQDDTLYRVFNVLEVAEDSLDPATEEGKDLKHLIDCLRNELPEPYGQDYEYIELAQQDDV